MAKIKPNGAGKTKREIRALHATSAKIVLESLLRRLAGIVNVTNNPIAFRQ
jgi:hypothetical protein